MGKTNEVKLSGKFVVGYVEGVEQLSTTFAKQARDILESNGIEDPSPEEQYPANALIESIEETIDTVGPATVQRTGASIARSVEWPPEVGSVETAFEVLDQMHQEVHINADEDEYGSYLFEKTEDSRARVACSEQYPYPTPHANGVVEGVLDTFTPDTAVTNVAEADAKSDEKCAFELAW